MLAIQSIGSDSYRPWKQPGNDRATSLSRSVLLFPATIIPEKRTAVTENSSASIIILFLQYNIDIYYILVLCQIMSVDFNHIIPNVSSLYQWQDMLLLMLTL